MVFGAKNCFAKRGAIAIGGAASSPSAAIKPASLEAAA